LKGNQSSDEDHVQCVEAWNEERALFSKNLTFCLLKGQLVLGLASGLEAFSREPPCDSIGALAFQQTPETSGMAWEFLSYYPKLPSRCLRDPLCYLVVVVFFDSIQPVKEVSFLFGLLARSTK